MTQDQKRAILDVLQAKLPSVKCPLCGVSQFTLANDLTFIVGQTDLNSVQLSGPGYPAVLIICRNCGNTHQLNIFVLGVADILGIKPGVTEATDKPKEQPEGTEAKTV